MGCGLRLLTQSLRLVKSATMLRVVWTVCVVLGLARVICSVLTVVRLLGLLGKPSVRTSLLGAVVGDLGGGVVRCALFCGLGCRGVVVWGIGCVRFGDRGVGGSFVLLFAVCTDLICVCSVRVLVCRLVTVCVSLMVT